MRERFSWHPAPPSTSHGSRRLVRTATRYVLTLATELRERNARYGAIGVCVGSGQAVAVVLENPQAG